MCCVPEPETKRVNWVMTSSITIDKLQKEEVYFIFSLFLLQVIFISSSSNKHLEIFLIRFVYRFASSTTSVTEKYTHRFGTADRMLR